MKKIKNVIKEWNLDYSQYCIEGVSHLYAVWYVALYIIKNKNESNIKDNLTNFYKDLRGDKINPQTLIYQQSMQSASRSKSSRKKRVNAILDFLGFDMLK